MPPAGYKIIDNLFANHATEVFRGINEKTGESVILRTCTESGAAAAQYTRLAFTHELLGLFDHPNIVKACDWVDNPLKPWLIMEDIHGCDLWAYAATFEKHQLPIENFLNIGIQLADALSVIHHAQVLHKDLHPGNVVINPETQQAQIIDFGLASLLSREQPILKAPEALEGLLPYLSPEQTGRMNRALDYRTDFYTLGVTFFELLTGQQPFQAQDALGLVYAHLAQVQTPTHEIREDIPLVISAIIDKLLNKNAEDRYQSALGLKHDLQQCFDELKQHGSVKSFKLATQDVSEHFQIPQILYGREQEVALLLEQFKNVLEGESRLFSVAGYSGIGKSTLVNEIHKPIAACNGLFLSGKFEQFQQNTPYSALKSALSEWINMKLRVSEGQLLLERKALLQALGANARALIDFMPEMSQVLGELAPLPRLGATETQARFHLLCQQFFKVVTRQKPWVLFVDDMQWSDRGTLNLIPELLIEPDTRLLIIVAYRDNEVDEHHPLNEMIAKITTYDKHKYASLTLGPLPKKEISHLLSDTLHRNAPDIEPLVALIFDKAGGNPFFTSEFLKSLYAQALLNFNLEQQCWTWNLEAIQAQSITDNVVDLMLNNMRLLPEDTQSILQFAACIGTQFDLKSLAMVSGSSIDDIANQLWPAIKAGLVIQLAGNCLPGAPDGSERQNNPIRCRQLSNQCQSVNSFKFLHDRMLQAAYESLSDNERLTIHLTLGRLMYQQASDAERESKLFEILEHLNKGARLITNNEEIITLATLNASGAEKAKVASVWEGANDYAKTGLSLLTGLENTDSPSCWQSHYDLSYQLHSVSAECEYLSGNVVKAEQLYATLFDSTRDSLDKARQCATRATQYIGRAEYEKTIWIVKAGLTCLNITLPEEKSQLTHFLADQKRQLDTAFKQHPLTQFHQLPEDHDAESQIAAFLLCNLGLCALITNNRLLLDACIISSMLRFIKYGKNDLLATTLSVYGLMANRDEDYTSAHLAAVEALKVKSLYPHCREGAATLNGVALSAWHLKHPLDEVIKLYLQGYEEGLQTGELARAGVCLSGICLAQTAMFTTPETMLEQCNKVLVFAKKNRLLLFTANITRQYALSLQNNKFLLKDDNFEPEIIRKINQSFFLAYLDMTRVMARFWLESLSIDTPASIRELKTYITNHVHLSQTVFAKDFYCFYCLTILRARQSGAFDQLNTDDKTFFIETFLNFEHKLNALAEFYAPNHAHKFLLLKAEKLATEKGEFKQVIHLYKQAASSAADNGFRHYEALAFEYYADYLCRQGLEDLAESPIQKAFDIYTHWHCQPKLAKLPERYECLRKLLVKSRPSSLSSHASSTSGSGTAKNLSQLDFASVVKSSQAISGELGLDKLIARVMTIIMENAGAQVGILILNEQAKADGEPLIEAVIHEPKQKKSFLTHLPVKQANDLPKTLIKQALRSKKSINLSNASVENYFVKDTYIQRNRPKSVLCQPVVFRDQFIGLLYLENNLVTSAFTDERLETIQTLLAQAAISFENSRLFDEIKQLNENLELKVVERTQALEQANEEIRAFNRTVSHDLRSPLRSLKNYSRILLEDYADKLQGEPSSLLQRIHQRALTMSELVNGLLDLSRVQGQELHKQRVSLSDMVEKSLDALKSDEPERQVNCDIDKNVIVTADKRMMTSLIDNLVSNAWKYTSKTPEARISFHVEYQKGQPVYVVRDNGAGFNMAYAQDLFGTFKRMHTDKQFAGTGIGLATVKKIIQRHGGDVWAEAEVNKGAAFYFTLPG